MPARARIAVLTRRRMAAFGLLFSLVIGVLHLAHAAPLPVRDREPQVTARTLDLWSRLDEHVSSQKVWVYFTDKDVLDDKALRSRLSEVALALDLHGEARRRKTLGPALVDGHDLPVSAAYVARLEGLGAEVVRRSRWLNAVSIRASLPELESIASLPFVAKLVPVRRGRSVGVMPSPPPAPVASQPPATGMGLDYGESFAQLAEIGVVAAHQVGLSGAGVRIAMLDTGFYRDHPAFDRLRAEGRLLAQRDFIRDDGETQNESEDPPTQHNHGTTTWSLVGGFAESELIGAAFGASFLLAKTEDVSMEEPIEEDNWAAAAEWADSVGADIISSSLSYVDWYTYEDMDGETAVTTVAADIAASRGILVCASAGNRGTQDWFYIGAPADADSILTVGGTMPDGTMWSDSSHGPTADGRTKPEVVARGIEAYGAQVPGAGPLYRHFGGTSVSCPLVAGAAALVLEAHPNWSAMAVREALMLTADNAQTPDNHRGWGRIDAMAAIAYTTAIEMPGPVAAPDVEGRLVAMPNPFHDAVAITLDPPGADSFGAAHFERGTILEVVSPLGRLVRRFEFEVENEARSLIWDARDDYGNRVPSGVYLLRLTSEGSVTSRKVVLER